MLVQYIRDYQHRPTGCVVALGIDKIGVSLCNPKDTFSKDLGRLIAQRRAEAGSTRWSDLDFCPTRREEVLFEVEQMFHRATRYFKNEVPSESVSS